MRIVVLTSETPANTWLVNQLLSRHQVAGIVVERRPLAQTAHDKVQRRRRLIRRYGLLRAVNKLLFNKLRARFLSAADARTVTESFFPAGAAIEFGRNLPTVVVESVNDAACLAFIKEHSADALAVCGTSVLKPEVFTLAPKGAINIHTGITPEYRCADPIFWALYHREPEKVGVTIHFVDRGIDTGPIIYQSQVPVHGDDTLASIYVRCIRRGAELYSCALSELENGTVRTMVRANVVSRAFLSIDMGLVQYLVFRWRFRQMAMHLNRRDGAPAASTPETPR